MAQPSHLKEKKGQTSDSFLDQLILERWEKNPPQQNCENLTPKNDLEAGENPQGMNQRQQLRGV